LLRVAAGCTVRSWTTEEDYFFGGDLSGECYLLDEKDWLTGKEPWSFRAFTMMGFDISNLGKGLFVESA
jgi:hypothetical protein